MKHIQYIKQINQNVTNFLPLTDKLGICISDNNISLVNIQGRILHQQPCTYNNHDDISDSNVFQIANGLPFFRDYNNIYLFNGKELIHKKRITCCTLQQVNNNVLAGGNFWDVNFTRYNENGFENQPFLITQGALLRSWAGIGIKIYPSKCVTKIQQDLSEKEIGNLNEEMKYCAYCNAGIAVIFGGQGCQIVDIINGKTFLTNDISFTRNENHKQLILSPYGLTISDKKLLAVMGRVDFAQFLTQRHLSFYQWREQQYLNENFPLENINVLITNAGIPPLKRSDFTNPNSLVFQIKCLRDHRIVNRVQLAHQSKRKIQLLERKQTLKKMIDALFQKVQQVLQ